LKSPDTHSFVSAFAPNRVTMIALRRVMPVAAAVNGATTGKAQSDRRGQNEFASYFNTIPFFELAALHAHEAKRERIEGPPKPGSAAKVSNAGKPVGDRGDLAGW